MICLDGTNSEDGANICVIKKSNTCITWNYSTFTGSELCPVSVAGYKMTQCEDFKQKWSHRMYPLY